MNLRVNRQVTSAGDLRGNSKRELPTTASTYFINLNKMFTFDPRAILCNSDSVLHEMKKSKRQSGIRPLFQKAHRFLPLAFKETKDIRS